MSSAEGPERSLEQGFGEEILYVVHTVDRFQLENLLTYSLMNKVLSETITATNATLRPLDACGVVLVDRRSLLLQKSGLISKRRAYITS